MIAALYIDPRGPYPKIEGVDPWDEARDARLYNGPWPVVAHPPCGPWGRLRHLQNGGDKEQALIAVDQVRKWGGVLEHPATSKLWEAKGLPKPGEDPDSFGGYTIEVAQVEWGHVARKLTWLYIVGVPRALIPLPPFPGRTPTHWVAGGGKGRGKVPPGIKVCSAQQRRRTPPLFARFLIEIALKVQK